MIKKLFTNLENLIFPEICFICRRETHLLCPHCRTHWPIKKQVCPYCAQISPLGLYCSKQCQEQAQDQAVGIFCAGNNESYHYQRLIKALRQQGLKKAAIIIGQLLGYRLKNIWQKELYDPTAELVIIPYPISSYKKRLYGFSPNELLAQGIKIASNWPMIKDKDLMLLSPELKKETIFLLIIDQIDNYPAIQKYIITLKAKGIEKIIVTTCVF